MKEYVDFDSLNGIIDILTQKIEEMENKMTTIEKCYPIGSIYISTSSTNPGTSLGFGSWIQIKDTFLVAAGSTYTAGSTGGSSSHSHTSAAHTHAIAGHTHTSAAHTHSVNGHTHTSASHYHTTQGHTLTISEMPSHGHTTPYFDNSGSESWGFEWNDGGVRSNSTVASSGIGLTGGGGSHSHGNTGSTTPGATGSTSLTTNSTTPGATGSTSLTTNSTTPNNTGSSSSLPPYLAINVWKRVA